MSSNVNTDQLEAGDELDPLDLHITAEFNESILQSIEDLHPRYMTTGPDHAPIVHPALLIVFSNLTRSPSFRLIPGAAAVQTHDDVRMLKPVPVGETVTITWKVIETYERRNRPYQVMDTHIVDPHGDTVLTRRTTNTFMAGKIPMPVDIGGS
ncbi:MAG: hypothetical protein QF554_12040 [Dehalococcoidia bacterium]|jgi:hypothetical protein|nr:hypothetical protein [Dehalococcoidia bacterium]